MRDERSSLSSIADSLDDIRGVLMDLAPKKTIGPDGEILSKSCGYFEDIVNKVQNDSIVRELDDLIRYVQGKEDILQSQSSDERKLTFKIIKEKLKHMRRKFEK